MKKGKKKSGIMKRMLSTILGLVMVITMFSAVNTFASGTSAPRDLSGSVKIQLVDFTIEKVNEGQPQLVEVIKNGAKVGEPGTVKVGNNAVLGYQFEVPAQVKANDYFIIKFPYVSTLKGFYANRPLMNGGEQIGSFLIDGNGNLKVTFSVNADYIYDGGLRFGAGFISANQNFELTQPGGGEVIRFPVVERTKDENDLFYPGKHVKAPVQPKMNKWGTYQLSSGYFVYSLVVNGESKEILYKANVSKTRKMDTKKNIIVIDELPDGMTFEDKNKPTGESGTVDRKYLGVLINLETPAYANGVITKDDITNTAGLSKRLERKVLAGNKTRLYVGDESNPILSFTIDETGNDKTWEEFQAYIKNQPVRTIGIWQNKKMIANVGTLPYTDVTYDALFGGPDAFRDALQNEVNAKKITAEQKERMEQAYIGQGIINFTFDYRGFIEGQSKNEYVNSAVMTFNKGVVYPRTMRIPYSFADGWAKAGKFKGSMEVEKKWIGTPADSVEVELSATNKSDFTPQKVTLSAASSWKHTFTDLPLTLNDGKQVFYTVKETLVDGKALKDSNYSSVIRPATDEYKFIVTNIEKRDIKVKKVWLDASGSPLSAPPNQKITLNLYKKGSSVPISYTERTLPIGGKWELTYSGFDKFDESSTEIEYEVRESSMPEGFTSSGAWVGDEFVITNQMKANPTREVTVSKVWKDYSGKILTDAFLPEVQVSLVKEGTSNVVSGPVNLNHGNNWTHTFVGLPIFDGNQMISYKVKENTALSGYLSPVVSGNMDDGFEVINQQESAKVKVTKKWKNPDGSDFSDKALPEIQVEVQKGADSSKVDSATLTKYDGWGKEFILPALDGVKKILYKVKELTLNGYTARITKDDSDTKGNTFIITNTREIREDIKVTKKWFQAVGEALDGADASIPENITLHLHEEKTGKKVQDLVLRKDAGWTGTFTNLPKYEANGTTPIVYEIREDAVAGFALEEKVRVPSDMKEAIVSNFKTKSVTVNKEWHDLDDQKIEDTTAAGLTATFEIHKKVGDSANFEKDATIEDKSVSGNGSVTFDSLPAVESGKNVEYKAVEKAATTGYTVVNANPVHDSNGNVTFINKKNPLPTRNITISKVWKKVDGTAGFEASDMAQLPSVEVSIYNKNDLSTPLYTEQLTYGNLWQKTLRLKLYEADGSTPIAYVVKETPVQGYTSDKTEYEVPDSNAVTITNTQEKIVSIPVEKKWKKADDSDYTAEELKTLPEVTVNLYEEKDKNKILGTKVISQATGWRADFMNLPKYDITGQNLNVYKVEEVPVAGYLDPVYDAVTDPTRITITNKKTPSGGIYIPPFVEPQPKEPEKEEPKKPEEKPEEPNKTEEPNTSEEPKTPEVPSTDDPNVIPNLPIPSLPIITVPDDNTPQAPPVVPMDDPEGDVVTETPPVPPSIPIVAEEIPELILDEDDVPLGDTEIEYDENGKPKKPSDKKSGEKRTLAKSGGLQTYFIPLVSILGVLFGLLLLLLFYKRKVKK